MHSPKDEAERVQLWLSLGAQPGVGAWFTVWRVSHAKRVRRAEAAPAKKLPRQACTA